jgi:hypothetical protein
VGIGAAVVGMGMNFLDIKAGEPIASGQRPPRTRKVSNSRRSAKLRAIDMAVKSKPIARLLASGMSIPNSPGNTMAVGSDRKAIADCDIHQRFGERCFASLFALISRDLSAARRAPTQVITPEAIVYLLGNCDRRKLLIG